MSTRYEAAVLRTLHYNARKWMPFSVFRAITGLNPYGYPLEALPQPNPRFLFCYHCKQPTTSFVPTCARPECCIVFNRKSATTRAVYVHYEYAQSLLLTMMNFEKEIG